MTDLITLLKELNGFILFIITILIIIFYFKLKKESLFEIGNLKKDLNDKIDAQTFILEKRLDNQDKKIDILENRFDNKINILENRFDNQDKKIDEQRNLIKDLFHMMSQVLQKTSILAKTSPLRLTDYGNRVLDDINLKESIEENYDLILSKISVKEKEDITKLNDSIIDQVSKTDFPKFDFYENLKKNKLSSLTRSHYHDLIAVYFRDLYFSKNSLDLEEVKD